MPRLRIEAQVLPLLQTAHDGSGLDALVRALRPDADSVTMPRWLLVFAHPDDEVLALGGHLERLGASRILTITDGAPADGGDAGHHGFASLADYRTARRGELLAALAHAGLSPNLAPESAWQVPDQQAGFHLASLARVIAAEIQAFQPQAVLTHPYEGGHPDHDACAFAVQAAVQFAAMQNPPVVFEAPSYHAGPDGSMHTGSFLSPDHDSIAVLELTPGEQGNKAARLACFQSQAETLAQFGLERELFRVAPPYDFTQRPHRGQLFYEQFPWGMDGDRFCQLAWQARNELSGVSGAESRSFEAHVPASAAV